MKKYINLDFLFEVFGSYKVSRVANSGNLDELCMVS